MEDFIKELKFLPKINFVSLNATDAGIVGSTEDDEQSTDWE